MNSSRGHWDQPPLVSHGRVNRGDPRLLRVRYVAGVLSKRVDALVPLAWRYSGPVVGSNSTTLPLLPLPPFWACLPRGHTYGTLDCLHSVVARLNDLAEYKSLGKARSAMPPQPAPAVTRMPFPPGPCGPQRSALPRCLMARVWSTAALSMRAFGWQEVMHSWCWLGTEWCPCDLAHGMLF